MANARVIRFGGASLLLLFATAGVCGAPRPGWTKAVLWPERPGERVTQTAVTALGAERLRDLESFSLVRIPSAAASWATAQAAQLGYRLELHEEWDTVFMPSGAKVNVCSPVLPSTGLIQGYSGGEGLFVIHLDSPPTPETGGEISAANLMYVADLPYNAVLVFGHQKDVSRFAAGPEVQWSSIYHPAFRGQPAKLPPAGESHRILVQLVDVPGNKATWARLRAANRGAEETNYYLGYRNVWIEGSSSIVPDLLADPYVVAIEFPGEAWTSGEREAIAVTSLTPSATEPYQDGTRPYKPAGDYRTWLANRDMLWTNDHRIAIADTGLPGYHQDITTAGRNIGYQTYIGGTVYDEYGHGTAVAGFALGDPPAGSTEPPPPQGLLFFWGMGLAPKTNAFSQRIGNAEGAILYQNEMTLANDARSWNCTVQTHSWNEYKSDGSISGIYTQKSQEFDVAVHDTYGGDGIVTPMPVTVSAGNKYGAMWDPSEGVLGPATAKNVLAVGAAESYRPGIGSCDNWNADSFMNVGRYSRRGTADGRIKPDIIAPATLASSARHDPGSGTCFSPPAEYKIDSGTSYAAPQAAAAYVLLSKRRGVTLTPAMLKAALIGNTLSAKGGTDKLTNATIGSRPNAVQGFGRLYLGDALAGGGSGVVQTYLDETSWTAFTGLGQTRSRTFTVASQAKPVVIVVAWTDHVAPIPCTNGVCLSRDIDLWIQSGNTYYTGNRIASSGNEYSVPQTVPVWDSRNNVEMIVIPPGTFTTFTLNLTTARKFDVGWPSWRTQPFAVYASNAQ